MLNSDEINLLLEAIEIWKDMTPMEGSHMVNMMNGMISGNEEQIKAAVEKAHEEAQRKRISRRERGILLQAKLIQMRDSVDVSNALDFLKRPD